MEILLEFQGNVFRGLLIREFIYPIFFRDPSCGHYLYKLSHRCLTIKIQEPNLVVHLDQF
jgi:ubiquinone biosynthesis protein UbiJ